MNKYMKLFLGNAAFAAGVVCLYSPGLIGLSPFSPNVFAAAASVAVGVVAVPSFVLMNRSLLAEKEPELVGADDGRADEKAAELLGRYVSSQALGGIAQSALSQIQRLESAESNFEKLVVRRFGAGTLSFRKFMGVMASASEALSKGMIRMANKMIIFDEAEYQKLASGEYLRDDIPDKIQEEKKRLYEKNLEDLRSILEKNEKVLLEVDHLMMELSDADYSGDDIEAAADQINELLRQLEYYK